MAVEFDVFLSHNSSDKPAVEEIGRRLEREGIRCWLDKWNLVPGEPWQEAIEEALQRSGACAVFLGPSGIGPWANEEMRVALTRRVAERRSGPGGRPGFRVIPVLLPGAPVDVEVPPFLGRLTWVRFGSSLDDEDAFHPLIRGIRGMAPGARAEFDPILEAPYRGLEVFDVNHAPLFFGREAWTERLLRKVEDSKRRFLAIVGPSGSGKSSLARAGVLAALQQGRIEGSSNWIQVICRPGAEPLLNLALALNRERSAADSYLGVRNLARDLVEDPSALHVAVRLALREAPGGSRLVLLIDQLEELFTHRPSEEERRAFLDSLHHAATVKDGPTLVIVTLRAEFYGRFSDHPIAGLFSDNHGLLGPMTSDEVRRAIDSPALRAGCELEPGLTDLLLRDVEGQPGSLPLLQYALLELWEQRRGRRLTVETYRNIGGVAGALRRRAEQVQETFSAEEREVICRRLLLLLAQPDEREGYSRRRARRDEVLAVVGDHAQAETVLNKLADARLVVTESTEGESFVEIAHEALIQEWPRLRGWIDERREELLLRSELGEAAERWNDKARDISYLFTGARLAAAEERSGEMGLGALEKEFLEASRIFQLREHRRQLAQAEALQKEQQKRAQEEARRAEAEHKRAEEQARRAEAEKRRAEEERRRANSERKRREVVVFAAGVAVLAAMLGTSWVLARREIGIQNVLSRSRNLSAQSGLVLEHLPQRGILLAREAVRLAEEAGHPHFPPAEEAMRRALALPWAAPLKRPGNRLSTLSPDHTLLATVNERDQKIRVWDLERLDGTHRPKALFSFKPSTFDTVAISPDNHWLSLLEYSKVTTWDLRRPAGTKPQTVRLSEYAERVFSRQPMAFSKNGRWLATWSSGEAIRVWRPGAPTEIHWIGEPGAKVATATFGGDTWLAVLYSDGSASLYSVDDGARILRFSPAGWELGDLIFRQGPHSVWLLAATDHGPMVLWDSSGRLRTPLRLPGCSLASWQPTGSLILSPRSRWLVSQRLDTCLWDLESFSKAVVLQARNPSAVAFRADERRLAVASEKGILLYDLTGLASEPMEVLSPRASRSINRLTFTSDGQRLAGSNGRTLWLWEEFKPYLSTSNIQEIPSGHDGDIALLGFSRNDRWLLTASFGGSPRFHETDRLFPARSADPTPLESPRQLLYWYSGWARGGRWLLGPSGLVDLDTFQRSNLGPPNGNEHRGHDTWVMSPDAKWIASVSDADTLIWRMEDANAGRWGSPRIKLGKVRPSAFAFSPDGRRLAMATEKAVEIRTLSESTAALERRLPQSDVDSLTFSPDGRRLVVSGSGRHMLWNIESTFDRIPHDIPGLVEPRSRFLFSRGSGEWLISYNDFSRVRLFQLADSEIPKGALISEWGGSAASLSERWLAIGKREIISLSDLKDLKLVPKLLMGHLGSVQHLAISPDNRWLASAAEDSTIRLWDLDASVPSATGISLTGYGPISWLEFSASGPWLFAAERSGKVHRWDLRMSCLKVLACRFAGRSLTREEWRTAIGIDEPPPDTCSRPLPKEEATECADVLAPYGG